MNLLILAQAPDSFDSSFWGEVILWGMLAIAGLVIAVYIVRAIFKIPTIVRLHKAQVQLLEQIAKKQGVEDTIISTIITESEEPGSMS